MTWLKTLVLRADERLSLLGLAEAIQHHPCLQALFVYGGIDAPKTEELHAFCSALKNNNFVLKQMELAQRWSLFRVPEPAVPILADINFYLALNKLGRSKLFSPGNTVFAPPEEWIQAMADQDDISILYYFLSKNPALCYSGTKVGGHKQTKRCNSSRSATQKCESDKRTIQTTEASMPNKKPRLVGPLASMTAGTAVFAVTAKGGASPLLSSTVIYAAGLVSGWFAGSTWGTGTVQRGAAPSEGYEETATGETS